MMVTGCIKYPAWYVHYAVLQNYTAVQAVTNMFADLASGAKLHATIIFPTSFTKSQIQF